MADEHAVTVGILYPGEMGANLGRLLRARGVRVVTTLCHRSERTIRLCREASLSELDSVSEVVRQSDVVISVVIPGAAEEVVATYCELAHLRRPGALFVDANSIGPEQAVALAEKVRKCGGDFVDATIHGQAKDLAKGAALYLSGSHAQDIADLFADSMRTRVVGNEPGRASMMKMCLAGLSKGMCSLFLEVLSLAQRRQILADLIDEATRFYPGLVSPVQRMLPTYPQHAGRRATEMRELEETALASGQDPCLFTAMRQLLEALSRVPFGARLDSGTWPLTTMIEHVTANEFLAGALPTAKNQTLVK